MIKLDGPGGGRGAGFGKLAVGDFVGEGVVRMLIRLFPPTLHASQSLYLVPTNALSIDDRSI